EPSDENQEQSKTDEDDSSENNKNELATFSAGKSLTGVAKKSPTNVRAKTSTKSKIIKQFPIGEVIEYKYYSKIWNQLTVKVNGKKEIGYINKKHVTKGKNKAGKLKSIT